MITLETLRDNEAINAYITAADRSLAALGYTEHSYPHVLRVAETAAYILRSTGHEEHEIQLARVAAYLHDIGRAQYVPITDDEAVDAFEYLARTEGIICAIESAHAVAQVRKIAKNYSPDQSIIVCLSGRGDKDVAAIARYRGVDIHD